MRTGKLSLITPPAAEPVLLDEIKAHLNLLDDSSQDGLVISAMIGARQMVEEWTERALVQQTLEWLTPRFPGCPPDWQTYIVLPRPPLLSVTSISYVDADGALQTVAAADYSVLAPSGPAAAHGEVCPAVGKSWPTALAYQRDAVRVRYVAGYGGPEAVPDPIRSAIKLMVSDLFEHREAQFVGVSVSANPTVERLLAPYTATRM